MCNEEEDKKLFRDGEIKQLEASMLESTLEFVVLTSSKVDDVDVSSQE